MKNDAIKKDVGINFSLSLIIFAAKTTKTHKL
jgi:hypothetical protein